MEEGKVYIVHNAEEMKKAWREAKAGDVLWLIVPPNPEDYGFQFSRDTDELVRPSTDWTGCCC